MASSSWCTQTGVPEATLQYLYKNDLVTLVYSGVSEANLIFNETWLRDVGVIRCTRSKIVFKENNKFINRTLNGNTPAIYRFSQ